MVSRLLLLWLLPLAARAELLVSAPERFSVSVPEPSAIAVCAGKLWVFSHRDLELRAFSALDGKPAGSIPLRGENRLPSALACEHDHLLAALGTRRTTRTLERIDTGETFPAPRRGRISGLACDEGRCAAVADGETYLTEDLRRWRKLELSERDVIVSARGAGYENPFRDWQSKLLLSKGRFAAPAWFGRGELALVDPFRAEVLLRRETGYSRWGQWGPWEGNLMMPKSIAALGSDLFAVADSQLKLVFLFTSRGEYRGALARDGALRDFQYPIALAALNGLLFVADFKADRVAALAPETSWGDKLQPSLHRANLYRREAVVRSGKEESCLTCHDGLVSDEWNKLRGEALGKSHPVHVAVKRPPARKLSLSEGKLLECSTCHSPHHETAFASNLNEAPAALCSACHEAEGARSANHPLSAKVSCLSCHRPHDAEEHLLVVQGEALCLGCHKERRVRHRSVEPVLDTKQAGKAPVHDGKLACVTCHEVHRNQGATSLRGFSELEPLCSSCHGAKAERLFRGIHRR